MLSRLPKSGYRTRLPRQKAIADARNAEREVVNASEQLKRELEWLHGDTDDSLLSKRLATPLDRWIRFAERIEQVLTNAEAAGTLAILEEHNKKNNQDNLFLLSPYLFCVIKTVEDRWDHLAKMPVLDRPFAEVRDHFYEASTKCKELADLLRRGPALFVALAEHREGWEEVLESMGSSFFQSPDKSPRTMTFDDLLDNAASSYARLARTVTRAKHNRRPAQKIAEAKNEELRSLIGREIESIFRLFLGRPTMRTWQL
jgi:hypothetical protein